MWMQSVMIGAISLHPSQLGANERIAPPLKIGPAPGYPGASVYGAPYPPQYPAPYPY